MEFGVMSDIIASICALHAVCSRDTPIAVRICCYISVKEINLE